MDLAAVTAAPTILSVGGKIYRVAPLSFLALGMLQVWINGHAKSPYDLAKSEADRLEVPAGERESWLAEPRAKSRGWKLPEVGVDGGWLDLMLSDPDGRLFFLLVALQACQPEMGIADIESFAAQIRPADFGKVVKAVLDMGPDDDEDAPGPKGLSPAASTPS